MFIGRQHDLKCAKKKKIIIIIIINKTQKKVKYVLIKKKCIKENVFKKESDKWNLLALEKIKHFKLPFFRLVWLPPYGGITI